MVLALPVLLVMLIILWRLLLMLYPISGEKLGIVCVEGVRLSRKHYSIIAIFFITCLGWLTTDLHGFSSGTVSLIPVIACFGFRLLNTQDFRTLSWDVLFMLGGGLSLGVGLKESGLVGELVAMVPEKTEVWIVVLAFGLLGMFMSTLISNTATANLLIPITVSLGGEAAFATMVVAMSCSGSMALPVSTPPNAIAFGSGILHIRQILTAGGIISILTLLAIFASYELYWIFLGIF
jgi:sodium-dependent dicarboxylate transporter 2/3/5